MNNLLPSAVNGTLVVVIPSREGVIVAADSLSSVAGATVASRPKLHAISTLQRLLFSITGAANFISLPPSGIEIQSWVQNAKPLFSGEDVLSEALSGVGDVAIDRPLLAFLANTLLRKFDAFFDRNADLRRRFSNQEICRPLFVRYEAEVERTSIATFLIRSNDGGKLCADGYQIDELVSSDPRYIGRFGEQQYVDKNVLRPGSVGRAHLGAEMEQLWNGPELIRDMLPANAARIATLLIAATEQTSRTVPITNAVGGKPLILLLDGKGVPRTFDPPICRQARRMVIPTTELVRREGESLSDVETMIEGRVFHVTRREYWPAILASGELQPNSDGKFPSAFGFSANSFFRKRRCVSLFDYRVPPDDTIRDFRCRCSPFQAARPGDDGIAILLLNRSIEDNVISWVKWKEEEAWREMIVPYVEAGYRGAIPVTKIDRVIFLRIEEDPNSIAAQLGRSRELKERTG